MLKIAILIAGYFLGSIPFGLIIGKAWRGIDIRQYGSGNIGATNVLRSLGPGPAAVVFAADVLKGFVPVTAAKILFPGHELMVVAAGILAILGHTLSLFLKFRGGKGVATSLGVIIGLDPIIAAVGFGIWILIVALSRYVSLASILTALCVSALMFALKKPLPFQIFTLAAALYIIVKHRSNISRLLRGKEARWGEKVKVTEEGRA